MGSHNTLADGKVLLDNPEVVRDDRVTRLHYRVRTP